MAIKGKTFDLQTITAKDDGALYRILSGESDMIVFSGSGTALSINSNILTIAECYLLIGGRYIHIEDGSTIDLGTIPNSSNRGRVIIKIDTSLGATQVTLDQVVPEIETIASGGSYRALVKNDINSDNGGSVYEIEFATFTCSSGVASSPALTTSVPTQSIIQTLQDDIDTLADNLETTGEAVGTLQTGKANAGMGIYNGTSLNDCTIAGWYYISSSITTSYIPVASWGILEVIRASRNDAGAVLQRFTAVNNGITYTRYDPNGTGSFTGWVAEGHSITRITYTSQALTGLSATFIKQSAITLEYGSSFLAGGSVGGDYFTLPVGKYKIHTHFATNPGANGYIKSCLKLASTSTTIIMTDKALTGAGLGSNATIIGIDGEDVFTIASNTTFRFLVMTSGNVEGFSAQVIIERI